MERGLGTGEGRGTETREDCGASSHFITRTYILEISFKMEESSNKKPFSS